MRLPQVRGWVAGACVLVSSCGAGVAGATVYPETVLEAMAERPAAGEQVTGLKNGRLLQCSARSNCVSTSSIKSVDKYSRPWAFEGSADGMFDKILAVADQMELRVAEKDKGSLYVHLTAKSAVPPTGVDDVELLINPTDHIITFRSNSREVVFAGTQQVGDRGSNRNRLQSLQRKLGVAEQGVSEYGAEYFQSSSSGLPFDGLLPSANLFRAGANEPNDINFLDNTVPEQQGQGPAETAE